MNLLLEASAQHDPTGAIVTGLVVFLALMALLTILLTFGATRPHTQS